MGAPCPPGDRVSDVRAISLTAAAKRLPFRQERARESIRAAGLVREKAGLGEYVIESELDAWLRGDVPTPTRPVRRTAERREGDAL